MRPTVKVLDRLRSARIVGYTEVILQRVREVIEENRRGTWTINAVIGN